MRLAGPPIAVALRARASLTLALAKLSIGGKVGRDARPVILHLDRQGQAGAGAILAAHAQRCRRVI